MCQSPCLVSPTSEREEMGWEVDLDWVGAVLITERHGEGERKVVRLIVYLLLFNLLPAHTCFNLGELYYQHSYSLSRV